MCPQDPDGKVEEHFVIVVCAGLHERNLTDSRPTDRKPGPSVVKSALAVSFRTKVTHQGDYVLSIASN